MLATRGTTGDAYAFTSTAVSISEYLNTITAIYFCHKVVYFGGCAFRS